MAIEPELAALMHQTVFIAKRTGQNEHGEYTYGADVSYICRIDYTKTPMAMQTVTSAQRAGGTVMQRVFISGAIVILAEAVDVNLDDRVTLDTGAILAVQKIDTIYDEIGPHHTEITA